MSDGEQNTRDRMWYSTVPTELLTLGIEACLSILSSLLRRRENPSMDTGHVMTDKRTRGPTN